LEEGSALEPGARVHYRCFKWGGEGHANRACAIVRSSYSTQKCTHQSKSTWHVCRSLRSIFGL